MGIFKGPKAPKIDNKPPSVDPVDPLALEEAKRRAKAAAGGMSSLRIDLATPGAGTASGVSIP